ncbi:MAG: TRAP transporter large permease [Lentisphaeria bacterium]|nr:TRAP transporter large permease [Lentisphaeria bacterium]
MSTEILVGILGCLAMVFLLTSSMPVGFVMALVGGVGFAILQSPRAACFMMTTELLDTFGKYGLTVIPLFVFMGQIAFHTGISRRLFHAAYRWLGPLPGGLAMATVGACTGFGAISGSGPATAATMASVALPEMRRYNYDMELGTGSVAAGGSLGMLIPPSVVFIVYAIMTEQSVSELFVAGIVPGLLIAVLFCLVILVNCLRRPHLGPVAEPTTLREKMASLLGIWETVLLFILVIGGMFGGFFTPTEAAAIGALGSLAIAACRLQLTSKMLKQALRETVRTSCMVMFIVAGAMVFGRFLAVTRIPAELARGLASLPLPGWVVMGGIILFFLFAGCFVDALALILLTIPIFFPVVQALHFDPVWFGVVVVVVVQMGVISPPVGVNAYVVSGIARDVPLQTVFKGTMPFLGALVVSAALLLLFPELCLFLPRNGIRGTLLLAVVAGGILATSLSLWGSSRVLGAKCAFGRSLGLVIFAWGGSGLLAGGLWKAFPNVWLALTACVLVSGTVFLFAERRRSWRCVMLWTVYTVLSGALFALARLVGPTSMHSASLSG